MTEVISHNSQMMSRDRKSRSPSVGAIGLGTERSTKNRRVTVIDGNFLREETNSPLAPKTSISPPTSSPPPPISPSLSSSGSYYPVSIGDQSLLSSGDGPHIPRIRSMTSPEIISIHSKSRHSRNPSDISLTSVSDDPSLFPHTHIDKLTFRPRSPSAISWRSSSSSLADPSLYSLVNQQSSEVSVLQTVKRQMMQTMKRTKDLQNEISQLPKLRKDVSELNQERKKLLNELLDQNAVVLQLKQRISLLHEQNQELAKVAKNDSKGGSVSAPILAIRNTLITTLAQLKQMEDQVQAIPSLRNQIRDLNDENTRLKEQEQQLVLPVPELPEGVSGSQYQAVLNENESLREMNEQLVTEVSTINKQLRSVSDTCDGLHRRMEMFHNSKGTVQSLQERIKHIEAEKDALHQQMVDYKISGPSAVDLDVVHLNKKIASLKRTNSKLQAKIESAKVNTKRDKEHLIMKLFEMELVNAKSVKLEMDKRVFDVERFRIGQARSLSSSVSPSPQPSRVALDSDEDAEARSLSPDSQLHLLKFKQLEIHSRETYGLLQNLMSERQMMEGQINELLTQLDEIRQSNCVDKLEETESKLALAQDRIRSLERGMKSLREATPDHIDGSDQIIVEKLEAMQGEIQRLSKVEREVVTFEGKLEQSKYTNEKLKYDKNKLEKKSREGRHRLKSLANELNRSVELVKNYQKQCMEMEGDLERSTEEVKKLKENNATLRAELQVKSFEMETHEKAGSNGAAATALEVGVVTELQDKYSQLLVDLSNLTGRHDVVTTKLQGREKELEGLTCEVDDLVSKEKESSRKSEELSEKLKELEHDNEIIEKEKETSLQLLSEKTKMLNELEIQLKELKESHQSTTEGLKSADDNVNSLTSSLKQLEHERDSLQQKVEILSKETPTLVKQSTELKVAKDEAERRVEALQKEQEVVITKVQGLEGKLEKNEKASKELQSKSRLLQADLDEAESKLDHALSANEVMKKQSTKMKEDSLRLSSELKTKEEYIQDARRELEREKERVGTAEKQLVESQDSLTAEIAKKKDLEKEIDLIRTVEISKLHSELSKTVSEMGQLTTDYSARLTRIRELETSHQEAQTQKDAVSEKLKSVERDLLKIREDCKKKEDELKEMKSSQASIVTQSRVSSEEVKKLKDEIYQYQMQKKKNDKEIKSLKNESSLLKDQSKINQTRLSDVQKTLQTRDGELRKAYDNVAVLNKEMETNRKKLEALETQCEMLTATKDNLLHRLDRMEKLEMEHDMLKHRVQETLGQSSQLRNDNKALLQLLEGVETERPAFEKEATKNLQEENNELHQQVSLLSQWNDKHQKTITSLETQMDGLEEEKRQILVELMKIQSFEQENRLLKKELGEVELEVNRLRRQAHTELLQEEMKVKLEAQTQLLTMFDEHNKALQAQVCGLNDQVKELGGSLVKDKPVSPPPMPEPSSDLQFIHPDMTRRCTELEVLNTNLQEKVAFLEAELISAQEISPKIRRRSSALLAASSIPIVPGSEEAFIGVPEELLLPCSVLADAYLNKNVLPESLTEKYLQTIAEGWFTVVSQKSVSAECLQGYTTTFGRLSQQLLKLIVNMRDLRGNTALHHTLANGNFPAVDVLLDLKSCNSNGTNKAGYTPLMLAAAHNIQCGDHKAVMQKLLDKTDLNIKSKVELQTALMLAASSGSSELVAMFLEAKANVNAQDKDGSTALMFACEKGYEDIVRKLLATPNCDASLKDNDSQTAYDIASSYSHNQICTHLKRHKKSRKK